MLKDGYEMNNITKSKNYWKWREKKEEITNMSEMIDRATYVGMDGFSIFFYLTSWKKWVKKKSKKEKRCDMRG